MTTDPTTTAAHPLKVPEGEGFFAPTTGVYQPLVITSVDRVPIFTVNEDGTWTGTVESLDDLARAVAAIFPRRRLNGE